MTWGLRLRRARHVVAKLPSYISFWYVMLGELIFLGRSELDAADGSRSDRNSFDGAAPGDGAAAEAPNDPRRAR